MTKKKEASVSTQDRHIVDADWIRSRYGISRQFIDRRVAEGSLRPFKIGNHRIRFYADEVVAYMERERLGA